MDKPTVKTLLLVLNEEGVPGPEPTSLSGMERLIVGTALCKSRSDEMTSVSEEDAELVNSLLGKEALANGRDRPLPRYASAELSLSVYRGILLSRVRGVVMAEDLGELRISKQIQPKNGR